MTQSACRKNLEKPRQGAQNQGSAMFGRSMCKGDMDCKLLRECIEKTNGNSNRKTIETSGENRRSGPSKIDLRGGSSEPNRGPTGQIGQPSAVGAHAEHANAKLLVSGTQPGRTRERHAAPAESGRRTPHETLYENLRMDVCMYVCMCVCMY